ncbi:protein amalgam-like [Homarus americanus]|uniref:protein amalgam-like n=1 Tax=Homarus americanus TaxID=6706 RepID=UPI001C479796|nr:protein amalgam-like [Homarus americanus]XP_042241771.1 protein amalgam-like [Homarus americanus]XP_042241773.1 protein amalgam-like [Homarus americanus]
MYRPLSFVLLTLLLLIPQGLSTGLNEKYNYNYAGESYYYDYEVGEEDQPTFLARSQIFTVEVGQSVIIPCDVENAGNNKLIIKKVPAAGGKEKLLVVGNERVTKDRRITVEGSRLTISHARPRDAGIFLCMFEMDPPIQLKHTLDVQFAPSIRSLAPPEQHVAKGITVTLECKAQGNPEPTIRWSRQEGPLPSGLRSEEGKSLTLEGVDRHVEGTYLCTADNGIGESASAAMTIAVEYPPEITTEKAIVRTGEGDKVELVCLVRGRPSPDVTWTRDGHPLPDTDMDTKLYLPGGQNASTKDTHLRVTHAAHRHILTINKVSEKDFGAYVCIAENSHGQKDAVIQMTGLPKPPQVTSSPNGGESNRYTLTWQTESFYPITEFIIKYRKTHLGAWQSNRTMVMAGSWENVSRSVEKDEVKVEDDTCHSMAFTVTGLEVATDYLAVIRVRNRYGWSSESQHFSFSTKKAMAVLQSTSGARSWTPASSPSSSSPLFYILLLLAFFLAEI